jgi:hypothetical protein
MKIATAPEGARRLKTDHRRLVAILQVLGRGECSLEGLMKRGVRARRERIETEARRLARSGGHEGFWSIEMALLMGGYENT